MPIDQGIRDLCLRVGQIQDPTEFETALLDLQIILRDHFCDIANLGPQKRFSQRDASALIRIRKTRTDAA